MLGVSGLAHQGQGGPPLSQGLFLSNDLGESLISNMESQPDRDDQVDGAQDTKQEKQGDGAGNKAGGIPGPNQQVSDEGGQLQGSGGVALGVRILRRLFVVELSFVAFSALCVLSAVATIVFGSYARYTGQLYWYVLAGFSFTIFGLCVVNCNVFCVLRNGANMLFGTCYFHE